MKIFIVCSYAPSIPKFRGSLIQELLLRGHNVYVVAPLSTATAEFYSFVASHPIDFIPITLSRNTLSPFLDLCFILKFINLLLTYKPKLIIPYTLKPVIFSGLSLTFLRSFGLLKNTRFMPLITGLGYFFTQKLSGISVLVKYLVLTLYRLSLIYSNGIIFQNPDDLHVFNSYALFKSSIPTLIVAGSGVDLATYSYSVVPKDPIFLMLSRLLLDKGIIEYFEAASIIRRESPSARFLLAGMFDTSPGSLSKPFFHSLLNDKHVEYVGAVEDVLPLLELCQCYVLPSYREGTPRSTLEALAVGRPIITTDVPGCRQTVIHQKNGYLVEPMSAPSLACALRNILTIPHSELQLMGDNSHYLAKDVFDVHKVNHMILDFIGI